MIETVGTKQVSIQVPRHSTHAWTLRWYPDEPMSAGEYEELLGANRDLRIERAADGEIIVMPPAVSETGRRNSEISMQLANWTMLDGSGTAFDSSAGFDLPNGSNRSPDASWIVNSRIDALSEEEEARFYPLCPDFALELRSDSDRLATLEEKMREYMANGARLGWLVDPVERKVHIYRPAAPVEVLDDPLTVSGDPELSGFTLELEPVWGSPRRDL